MLLISSRPPPAGPLWPGFFNLAFDALHKLMIKVFSAKLSVGKRFQTPPSIIWDVITDTAKWPQWGPTVKKVEFPERFIYKGATGRVLTAFHVWLPFEILEFEIDRFWNWKVAAVTATGHRVQAIDNETCELWFEVPLVAAPYGLICRLALTRIENLLIRIT